MTSPGNKDERDTSATLRNDRETFKSDPTAMALLEAMPGPAMVINARRQVVHVNQRLRRAVDLRDVDINTGPRPGTLLACRHALTGANACGTTEACEMCGANRAIRECMATNGSVTQECRIQSANTAGGGALDFRAHAAMVEILGANFLILALEDISSEKRRSVLERTFFHDLLNTCGGVQGLADLLAEPGNDQASEAELKADLRRLSGLAIDQIASQRQLLAAERGELAVQSQAVSIAPFLEDVVALYRHHEVAQGRQLTLHVPGVGTIDTDPVLLGRVVGNLVKNALEATPPGSTVAVRAEPQDDRTVISVHNPGVIPREIQLQIFQRSFSTKGGEGRGVGTYSVRLFTEQYLHGTIRFESVEGAGTTFEVTLPGTVAQAAAA